MNWLGLFIGLLTVVLVIDCLILVLLILMQLPKKEAGLGTAFGGGATDALFGAGSGNVLTKVTKYCAGIFLLLCMSLSVLHSYRVGTTVKKFDDALERQSKAAPATTPATVPMVMPGTNLLTTLGPAPATNVQRATTNPAVTVPVPTNAPAAAPK